MLPINLEEALFIAVSSHIFSKVDFYLWIFSFNMILFNTVTALLAGVASAQVTKTLCGGKNYTYESLAGYGLVPSSAKGTYFS